MNIINNINDTVFIFLTKYGVEVYSEHIEDLKSLVKEVELSEYRNYLLKVLNEKIADVEKTKIIKMPFWEMMNIFANPKSKEIFFIKIEIEKV